MKNNDGWEKDFYNGSDVIDNDDLSAGDAKERRIGTDGSVTRPPVGFLSMAAAWHAATSAVVAAAAAASGGA